MLSTYCLYIYLREKRVLLPADSGTNLGGILSIPVDFFWSIFFKSFLTCSEETNA